MKGPIIRLQVPRELRARGELRAQKLLAIVLTLLALAGALRLNALVEEAALQAPLREVFQAAGLEPVPVVLTSDPLLNCGALLAASSEGGCFRQDTPDRLYISPELEGEELKYVLLHEYFHYLEYQEGRSPNECHADRFALLMGAKPELAAYASRCEP